MLAEVGSKSENFVSLKRICLLALEVRNVCVVGYTSTVVCLKSSGYLLASVIKMIGCIH